MHACLAGYLELGIHTHVQTHIHMPTVFFTRSVHGNMEYASFNVIHIVCF